MKQPTIVTQDKWNKARKELLIAEKHLQKQRDDVNAQRQKLPWVAVTKEYQFQSPDKTLNLVDLFGTHSQLIVQHFMMGASWDEGCPSCSLWACLLYTSPSPRDS